MSMPNDDKFNDGKDKSDNDKVNPNTIPNTTKKSDNTDKKDNNNNEKNNQKNDFSNMSNPMSLFLNQIISEAFKINPDNPNSGGFYPTIIDFKIENYDGANGIRTEQMIFSANPDDVGNSVGDDKEEETDEDEQDANSNPSNKKSEFDKKTILVKSLPDQNSNNNSSGDFKKKITIHKPMESASKPALRPNSKNRVDYLSSIGDLSSLDQWLKSNLSEDLGKFTGSTNDYTTESIDNASANGKLNILKWWKKAHIVNGVELKYTEKAINFASKNNHVSCLDWWYKESGLDLKYNHNAIDYASSKANIEALDWWLKNSMSKTDSDPKIRFEHTSNSLDHAKLKENQLLDLVKWWKSTIETNPEIKFKYTRDFIDYLEAWGYKNVYEYLQEHNMISKSDLFNSSNANANKQPSDEELLKRKSSDIPFSSIFEIFGLPIKIGSDGGSIPGLGSLGSLGSSRKKQSSSKVDISTLPEEIQKHIADKEEELNNSMSLNGKTKEYIDNLVKIPFGKFKIEKIFSFIEDLIKKINTINSSSSNDFVKSYSIANESDLVGFFEKVKLFPTSAYVKYIGIYDNFVQIRKNYMKYVNNVLNDCVYGHESTKKHIKCIISQWLSGGFKTGVVIGIQGPPGVGKTTMIKGALSKCLIDYINYDFDSDEPFVNQIDIMNKDKDKEGEKIEQKPRPFCFTSLGGTTNGSTLSGHNITYHGATSGDIVKHLKDAEIMNPILYFDELDKISNTEHGHEISSVLTHITDPVQNSHFTDRYFAEVKIDLSKCIIVFSYNDTNKIDRILLDRIQEIRLNPIKPSEKLIICKKYIIPEICSQLGYNPTEVVITDSELNLIINEYTMEAGVRKLKEKLFEVFRMGHLEYIESNNSNSSNSSNADEQQTQFKTNKKEISTKFIEDVFSDYPKVTHKKISQSNMIGCINGLYASSLGIGGITPIQVKQIYSKENLGISITGSVEKVMEESVKVARTVAWNLLDRDTQNKIIETWDSRGMHIHFPDGSTSKDGPSAGTAITCSIYSLFTSKPIKNNVAITGEINLDGEVTQIGGLDAKLNGAKKAGIKIALVPKENHRELEIVKRNNPNLIGKDFKVFKISHVNEALKYIF